LKSQAWQRLKQSAAGDWEMDIKPLLAKYLTASETIFSVYEDFKHAYEY